MVLTDQEKGLPLATASNKASLNAGGGVDNANHVRLEKFFVLGPQYSTLTLRQT